MTPRARAAVADVPPQIREAVHARVLAQLPAIVHQMTDGIGREHRPAAGHQADGDRAISRRNPELVNRIFPTSVSASCG